MTMHTDTGSDGRRHASSWMCTYCTGETVHLADDETLCPKCHAQVRRIGSSGITIDFRALFREERAAKKGEERRLRQLALAAKRAASSTAAPPAPRSRSTRTHRSAAKSDPADDGGDAVEVVGAASAARAPSTANEPSPRGWRVYRVTLIGRVTDPDRWSDLLAECLEALSSGEEVVDTGCNGIHCDP